jgi:hypothetical protein
MGRRFTRLAIVAAALASMGCDPARAARPKGFTLPYSGETRFSWRYPKAEGALTVNEDVRRRGGVDWEQLSLICQADGSLRVEVRRMLLSSDVPLMINAADYTRLAVSSGRFRLETTLTPRGNGFERWSQGVFPGGARSVSQLLSGPPLVFTGVNRKPRAARTARDEDLVETFPAPDWNRTAAFRAGCARVSSARDAR